MIKKNALSNIPKFWLDIILLILIFAPIYFLFLGNRPFATPDEARYVEIPREMLATQDWITPRLNGVKYFEKPPLLYWILAILQSLLGLKEWAMRLPIVIFGLTGVLSTYAFVSHILNRHKGIYAAFILGSSCLYFVLSRLIILDMAVSLFVTLSLYCFYIAQQEVFEKRRRVFFALFTIFCALGVLTKGLMALVIPGIVIILWATLSKRWRSVFPAYVPTNLILFLIITAPWHLLASYKNPEFAYKYFIVEHILRYSTTIHLRHQPIWFFIPIIFGGFLPWSALFGQVFRDAFKNRQTNLTSFLLIWTTAVFVFFSISQSKLIPYVLPLFPPIAILIANYLDNLLTKNRIKKWPFKYITCLSFACCLATIFAPYFITDLQTTKIDLVIYVRALFIPFFLLMLFSLPVLNIKRQIYGIGMSSLLILLILIPASPHIQRPSINNLVARALSQRKPDQFLASYMSYFQDLPVYANEIVTVVDTKGELEFGTLVEDTRHWMMSREDFKNRLSVEKSPAWIFVRDNSLIHLKNDNPNINFKEISFENGIYLILAENIRAQVKSE